MSPSRWAVSLLGALAITGCVRTPPPAPAPYIPPPGISDDVRQRMQKQNPDVQFGSVVAVRAEDDLAAVSGVTAAPDDAVSFYAGDEPIAVGSVVRVVNNNVQVRYRPEPGGRAPQVGDVVVKLPPRNR